MREAPKNSDDKDNEIINDKGIKAVLDHALQSYEKLPMLKILFGRFSQYLATAFQYLTSEALEIKIESFESLRFVEYFKSLNHPIPIAVFKAVEWENLGLIVFEQNLINTFIDILLGGKKNLTNRMKRDTGKVLTSIEQTIVKQLVDVILTEMSATFETVRSTTFVLDRIETNPNFTAITRSSDAIIVLKISIEIENRKVHMDLVIPYKTIEPIKEQLQQVFLGDNLGTDRAWREMLFKSIYSVEMPLEAIIINKKPVKLKQIAELKIGDTILIDHLPDEDILLRTEDVLLFTGQVGKIRDKVAININNIINDQEI